MYNTGASSAVAATVRIGSAVTLALMSGIGSSCSSAAPVVLTREGGNAVLANGIITATIDTAGARVVSMKYDGHEMVQTPAARKHIYFSMAGGASYEQPNHCLYTVTKQQPDLVDISCRRVYTPAAGDKHAWDIDVHYALRSGDSGFYAYAVLEHPASYPDAGMGEWRTVWWMPTVGDHYLMERIYVDALRNWQMPALADYQHAEPTGIAEIVKLTTGLWAGKYDCKYAFNADYAELGAYGHASNANHVGAWIVLGGHEYFNDGPTKQDLTAAAGIIHLHLYQNHYNAPGFTIKRGQDWKKLYGPWLLYCNNKPTADANWADAKARAAAERAAWPYSWLSNSEYPPASERGTVTGKLVVNDKLKPALNGAGAWVGLALPEATAGNWQVQGAGYQYWVRAGADGGFTIPAVRPGSYTLYAFTRGAVGEFSKADVVVKAGAATALGEVPWQVPHPGNHLAWEIGVPDRSAAEFRHGGTDYWEPYVYTKFAQEFANPLEYDVAKQNWATALNYAHTAYGNGEKRQPWKWRLNFNLDAPPAGNATLTMAFAGSNGAGVQVFVNDEARPLAPVAPPNRGGNALLRESNHAKYGLSYVPIPASRLKRGANTITLVTAPIKWDGDHVMYDYLSLELP